MSDSSENEEGFIRANKAHDWLQRFESKIRSYIDNLMTRNFGEHWAKSRLPQGMYDKWRNKKIDAEDHGGPIWPLICYADFTEYEPIIRQRNNWKEVFAVYFRKPESITESLQRMHIIRLSTMHSRQITHEDLLCLYVEVTRIIKVIS